MEDFKGQYSEENKELIGRHVFTTIVGRGNYRNKKRLVIVDVLKAGFTATDGARVFYYNWFGREEEAVGFHFSGCSLLTESEAEHIEDDTRRSDKIFDAKRGILKLVNKSDDLEHLEDVLELLQKEAFC